MWYLLYTIELMLGLRVPGTKKLVDIGKIHWYVTRHHYTTRELVDIGKILVKAVQSGHGYGLRRSSIRNDLPIYSDLIGLGIYLDVRSHIIIYHIFL